MGARTQSIDVQTRKQLAQLLRRFVAGLITNDEFESQLPRLHDLAARQVFSEGAWHLYDDLHEHRLTGKHRLDRATRAQIARWILFLETDLPYEWPVIPPFVVYLVLPVVNLLTLGATTRLVASYLQRGGDADVWPFRRRADYERALPRPPYLHG